MISYILSLYYHLSHGNQIKFNFIHLQCDCRKKHASLSLNWAQMQAHGYHQHIFAILLSIGHY